MKSVSVLRGGWYLRGVLRSIPNFARVVLARPEMSKKRNNTTYLQLRCIAVYRGEPTTAEVSLAPLITGKALRTYTNKAFGRRQACF